MLPGNTTISAIKLRPIIKWTGGKFDEYEAFARYIPSFKNYYEPFFGGGGVFFALQPIGQSFINDKSTDLATFYRQIPSSNFKKEMMLYVQAWEEAGLVSQELCKEFEQGFFDFLNNRLSSEELLNKLAIFFNRKLQDKCSFLFCSEVVLRVDDFTQSLIASVADKTRRIKRISVKEGRHFELSELADHIETGVKSGLYLFLRKLMNENAVGKLKMTPAKSSAIWYFVREFCYASMFRFNRKGEFNIPYGGIAYNRKNYRKKVENVFASNTKKLFKNVTIFNTDFADFLDTNKPSKNDFVFFDPPYDSEFSEYDQNAFTANDQKRLRDTILKLKAKCMVVVKETPLILELYSQSPFHIVTFDKTYTYNVRGRNNRDTRHLIILNYPPDKIT